MRINIKLMGALRNQLSNTQGSAEIDMESGATVDLVLEKLQLPTSRVHLVMVNGEMVHNRARPLADGDELTFFPPVAGG
jgi:molybdopterin converting factor small subunit